MIDHKIQYLSYNCLEAVIRTVEEHISLYPDIINFNICIDLKQAYVIINIVGELINMRTHFILLSLLIHRFRQ